MSGLGHDVSDLIHCFDDDQDLAREAVSAFRECSPGMIATIERALNPFDVEALEDATHSMKGAVSHFPAPELYAALAELGCSRTGDEAQDRFGRVRDELSRFEARLDIMD